jgi:hypothetical protein
MATATEQETVTVTFQAKVANMRIAMEPAFYAERNASGRVTQPGFSGHAIQFEDGEYTTDDPDEIEFIRGRPYFNQFATHNAIWEKDAPPEEPQPTIREQTKAINKAARAGDVEKLGEIAEQEKASHNRDAVLDEIKSALAELAGDGDE